MSLDRLPRIAWRACGSGASTIRCIGRGVGAVFTALRQYHFIDLFCGIGGFHLAAQSAGKSRGVDMRCVFASDIDPECRKTYAGNFGLQPEGDITQIDAAAIPPYDLLFGGFPCQPFSIIGSMRGFEDTRGTLFFEIARLIEAARPRAFVLENVKALIGHRQGRTIGRIMETLHDLGYQAGFRAFNALDFGLPQKRERVLIVGFREPVDFIWPEGGMAMRSLSDLLEPDPPARYWASEKIRASRQKLHQPGDEPTIWHENKSGNVSKHSYSCALRAGASYNYLLVDGARRLTERELLRLQGFPDSFRPMGSYQQVRRQTGNAVPVPLVGAVIERVIDALESSDAALKTPTRQACRQER